jgi:VCBS repeat-containing protein
MARRATTNSDPGYSVAIAPDGVDAGDDDLEAALSLAGTPAETKDATYLEFSFNVTDPNIKSITFDLVSGSDEFPQYIDDFVDIAGVFVNDVNYALFDNDPTRPLSVLQRNIASGHFINNTGEPGPAGFTGPSASLPIEYNGVSVPLSIVAPVRLGLNTIKIAIADTGDEGLDSGLFVSNLRSSTETGGGIVLPQSRRLPDAVDDVLTVSEDRFSLDARTFAGSVLANDTVGTNPAAGVAVVTAVGDAASSVGQAVQGRYGTLLLRADGSYTYTLSNTDALIRGETGVERFAYTIGNAGGLADTAVLEIRIQGEDLEIARTGVFSAHRGADRIGGSEGEDRLSGRAGDDVLLGAGGQRPALGRGRQRHPDGRGGQRPGGGGCGRRHALAGGGRRPCLGRGGAGHDLRRGRRRHRGRRGRRRPAGARRGGRPRLGRDGCGHAHRRGRRGPPVGGRGRRRGAGSGGRRPAVGRVGGGRAGGRVGVGPVQRRRGRGPPGAGRGRRHRLGGEGDDVFVAGSGADVIKDFQNGDRIDVSAHFGSFAALKKHMEEEDGDVVIDLSGASTLTVEKVDLLDKGDFLF